MPIAVHYPAGDLDTSGRRLVEGSEYVAQKIRQVLLFIKGEWFADLNLGTPWFEEILIKNPSLELIRGIIRDKVKGVPGVTSVPVIDLSLTGRTLAISFTAKTKFGDISDTLQVSI